MFFVWSLYVVAEAIYLWLPNSWLFFFNIFINLVQSFFLMCLFIIEDILSFFSRSVKCSLHNFWYTSFLGQIDILFCVSPCDLDGSKDLQTEDDEVQKGETTIPTIPEQQPIHTEGKLFQKMWCSKISTLHHGHTTCSGSTFHAYHLVCQWLSEDAVTFPIYG